MANINATSGIPQYSPSTPASFGFDSFGRTKVSEPYTLFDSSHRYKPSGDFSDLTGGNGHVNYLINESTESLNVLGLSGDYVFRESKKVFPYQPGKALQVMQTFVFNPAKIGLRQRAGYFSKQNGVFLQLEDNTLSIVKRSFTGGIKEDIVINQNLWNVDKFDGLGPSRISLDISKAQILFTEYEWLGVGSVKVGFAINGQFYTAHQFNHANILDKVYMTTATLPVRYEIENIADTGSGSSMKQICVSVLSNGGYDRNTESWSAPRPTLYQNVGTTYIPISAIRLATGRMDSVVKLSRASAVTTTSNNIEMVVLRNPTLTGGSWVTSETGNVEYNISATGVSGGTRVRQLFISGSNQSNAQADIVIQDGFDMQLGRTNADNPVSDIFVLAVRTLSGTADITGALHWFDH